MDGALCPARACDVIAQDADRRAIEKWVLKKRPIETRALEGRQYFLVQASRRSFRRGSQKIDRDDVDVVSDFRCRRR